LVPTKVLENNTSFQDGVDTHPKLVDRTRKKEYRKDMQRSESDLTDSEEDSGEYASIEGSQLSLIQWLVIRKR
jgi:hypothetical protein